MPDWFIDAYFENANVNDLNSIINNYLRESPDLCATLVYPCWVFLEKGGEIMTDYVISAADLHTTIYNMLDGKYIEPQHEELFNKAKIFESSLQVSVGVNMDFPDSFLKSFSKIQISSMNVTEIY